MWPNAQFSKRAIYDSLPPPLGFTFRHLILYSDNRRHFCSPSLYISPLSLSPLSLNLCIYLSCIYLSCIYLSSLYLCTLYIGLLSLNLCIYVSLSHTPNTHSLTHTLARSLSLSLSLTHTHTQYQRLTTLG